MTPELQAKFQQRLKDLTENAQKKKNVLEYQEVVDAFTDLNLQPEDVEKVYDHLENAGIDVIGLIEEVPDDKEDLDLREPGALDRVGELLDLDSFALCYAIETYTGNVDRKLEKNTAHWRVRVPEDGAAGDGRWRCTLFDLNHTSCYRQGDADVLEEQLADDSLFRALMTSPDFCDRYYGWLLKLAREVFTPERAGEALDEYIALMEPPLTLEHARFSRGTGLKGLNTIRAFFPERQAFITRLCEDYFADAGENGRGGTHGETARNSGKEGEAP